MVLILKSCLQCVLIIVTWFVYLLAGEVLLTWSVWFRNHSISSFSSLQWLKYYGYLKFSKQRHECLEAHFLYTPCTQNQYLKKDPLLQVIPYLHYVWNVSITTCKLTSKTNKPMFHSSTVPDLYFICEKDQFQPVVSCSFSEALWYLHFSYVYPSVNWEALLLYIALTLTVKVTLIGVHILKYNHF